MAVSAQRLAVSAAATRSSPMPQHEATASRNNHIRDVLLLTLRDRRALSADFFGEKAIARSNESVGSRLFLDPYHVADGNLWAENFLMSRFQRGGMTSLAGRSKLLKLEPEKFGKEDMQSRARSKYLEPEGGRFVPPLKPACSRDKGPDPYGTYKHVRWTIQNTGYLGGMGTKSASSQTWSTYALARPNVSA